MCHIRNGTSRVTSQELHVKSEKLRNEWHVKSDQLLLVMLRLVNK